MNNNHSHGGNFNAFLWGTILGAGAVFLLGTKKGKMILKTISEEGIELKELFEEEEDVEEKCEHCKPEEKEAEESPVASSNGGAAAKIVSSSRRFFRRTPKKS